MSSNIAAIIDYSAAVAARVQGVVLPNGSTVGVRAVYGAGQGLYTDPLRAGQTIAPIPDRVTEPLTHTSDLPDAPSIEPLTQEGSLQLLWTVPMRLYMNLGDLATLRATLLPFYDAYLAAFWPERQLDGLALLAYITSFKVEADDEWAWLAMDLSVLEIVRY